jgi:hypothetical protein
MLLSTTFCGVTVVNWPAIGFSLPSEPLAVPAQV